MLTRSKQHDWLPEHGQRRRRALLQHDRQRQHGQRISSALKQYDRFKQHRAWGSAGSNLTTGSNNIDIGNGGVAERSEHHSHWQIRDTDRKPLSPGFTGKIVANGVGVIINPNGQLGTIASSARFKEEIKPMDKASEAILALKPVTFRYKEEIDPDGIPQFGLMAEEVEKVNPDLVVRDEEGKLYTCATKR